jgi:hypothetical protein
VDVTWLLASRSGLIGPLSGMSRLPPPMMSGSGRHQFAYLVA